MSLKKINIRNSVLVLMIVLAAATRMLNVSNIVTWANFTPVGAVALFGGAYFSDKWKAYLVPLAVLLISDLLINYFQYNHAGLYQGWWTVYISFAVMVFIGTIIKKVNVLNVVLASVVAVAAHWLLTDMTFGSTLYAPGLTGYMQSLAAAIPFEIKMIYGNLFFCALLFGSFELAKSKYTVLQTNKELAV
ncbi:hypothetical protein KXQ82_05120 [Mucilaginibacter sp. HMF5004]|uniref:DUF6580 family putative transport protein n=1 Tax=Mucilaginibacter rivuli TaxID=2857527 RepID=UPI001C601B79|nr:DUF6580 family putative transport protein [Mucilaginibacter rivuli]MBW4889082.1 hypothetical protein [Mucilaginibacter rivuli]